MLASCVVIFWWSELEQPGCVAVQQLRFGLIAQAEFLQSFEHRLAVVERDVGVLSSAPPEGCCAARVDPA
jgi:hypothetical protein